MEKKLNQRIAEQFVSFYQIISETNSLDNEITEIIRNNRPGQNGLSEEKWEELSKRWHDVDKKIDEYFALAKDSSTIFEADVNVLAIERNLIKGKQPIKPVNKKYSKLRIYFQSTDNASFSRHRPAYKWTYPQFGMALICSLSFNDRVFKFEIAKTGKGSDKVALCKLITEDSKIICKSKSYVSPEAQEIKFQTAEKFAEVINICEIVTEKVNAELEKAGLEKLVSNIEIIKT